MFDLVMNVLVFGGVALVFIFAIVLSVHLGKRRERFLDRHEKDNWRGW